MPGSDSVSWEVPGIDSVTWEVPGYDSVSWEVPGTDSVSWEVPGNIFSFCIWISSCCNWILLFPGSGSLRAQGHIGPRDPWDHLLPSAHWDFKLLYWFF